MVEAMLQIPDLLSVPQAAKQMSLNPETVRRHIRGGTLPAVKIGQQWFITKEDRDAFLASYDRKTGKSGPVR